MRAWFRTGTPWIWLNAGAIALCAVEFPLFQNVPAIKQMVERLGYNSDFCSNS